MPFDGLHAAILRSNARCPRRIVRCALAAVSLAGCARSTPAPSVAADRSPSEMVRLRQDVEFLARPALEGRLAGTPGADSSANFIAQRFSDLGLRAAFTIPDCRAASDCRRSYFQLFHTNDYTSVNVGAIVGGSDPSLRDEYVVIAAHYDHIGRWSGGMHDSAPPNSIHPGADDNASGTSAMLELARRLGAQPPRRSVMLLAFGAEEMGLVGSRAFVESSPVDLRRIVLVLNLDMVGRLRGARVSVFGADRGLRTLVENANIEPRFSLALERRSSGRSDDFPFASRGVPALHVTTGEHADYHRVTDTANRIELEGLARVTDFTERIARAAADGPGAGGRR